MEKQPLSLLEWAYAQIRDQIMSGEMEPGKKVVVNQIAESLSISPTPVKEAMNRLVAEGLMDMLPRRGFVVKQLSMDEIRNIMDCRIMMETFAAIPAAKNFHVHPEIQVKMREVLRKMADVQANDYVTANQYEQIYHGSIIRLTENQKLTELYDMLMGVSFSFLVYASSRHPMERHEAAHQEHKLMYECLEEGEGKKLEILIRTHLENTMKLYETFLPAYTKKDTNISAF
ncbi:GntR family transcriptional regulator [Caproiciproducens sp. CPB-2]|uniref:GntR family transcriptional regulator n=1 Tax=unclassified Caproiciproducens TaxID=2643836 RepID=UPI0023DABE46|nr:GntR family transcriptional regulator [Caproiciproducens sp. CPB-2]MDF1496357.1 GntR family transcriptional regulator [Caproiciproducens sp. CPB-2]